MKSIFKRVCEYIGDFNTVLLILYSSIVFSAYAVSIHYSPKSILRGIFLSVLLSVIICPKALRFVRNADCSKLLESSSTGYNNKLKILFFAAPFVSFLIRYIAYYPGGLLFDSLTQYYQSLTNSYYDWHPAIQTLLAVKLPLFLTGNWFGAVVLFQLTAFAAVICYTLCSVAKHINSKTAFIIMLLFCLSPNVCIFAVTSLKDVSFAIGALLSLTYVFKIYFTDGEWIKSPFNTVALIVVLALTTLFRHNALLFTVPLVCVLLLLVCRKKALIVFLGILVVIVGVRVPLYSYLNVTPIEQSQEEVLGVPLTVIGGVVSKNPDSLDDEVKEFAYKVLPKEAWENEYNDDYNSVKRIEGANGVRVVYEYGSAKVIEYMFRCFKASPIVAFKSLEYLTGTVYSVLDDYGYYSRCIVARNSMGVKMQGVPFLQKISEAYTRLCEICFLHIFYCLGTMHLLLIIVLLAKCNLKKQEDLKKLFLAVPLFAYNFGTMLLLTGAGDSSRFFFYTFLIVPLLLIIILKDKKTVNEPQKTLDK